jgi:hypothetical protein
MDGARSTADVYQIAPPPTGSVSEIAAALDVRPWRREAAATACGMAFEPHPREAPMPGREWYGGTRGKRPLLTDLFPPANRS